MDEADRRNGEGPANPIDRAIDEGVSPRADEGPPDRDGGGALGTAAAAPTTPAIPTAMSPRDGGGGDPGPEDFD